MKTCPICKQTFNLVHECQTSLEGGDPQAPASTTVQYYYDEEIKAGRIRLSDGKATRDFLDYPNDFWTEDFNNDFDMPIDGREFEINDPLFDSDNPDYCWDALERAYDLIGDQMIIMNESDLRDTCREICVCHANRSDNDVEKMVGGILDADHPAFGTDWSAWWAASEDRRLAMVR